jgi:cytochrome c-type biogenesis protein CcmH/NrfF
MMTVLIWIAWLIGVALLVAMTGLALYVMRQRRLIAIERDAAERIKAFEQRRA